MSRKVLVLVPNIVALVAWIVAIPTPRWQEQAFLEGGIFQEQSIGLFEACKQPQDVATRREDSVQCWDIAWDCESSDAPDSFDAGDCGPLNTARVLVIVSALMALASLLSTAHREWKKQSIFVGGATSLMGVVFLTVWLRWSDFEDCVGEDDPQRSCSYGLSFQVWLGGFVIYVFGFVMNVLRWRSPCPLLCPPEPPKTKKGRR